MKAKDQVLFVTLTVEISDCEFYSHEARRGGAVACGELPRSVLEKLNALGVLEGLMAAALVKFDKLSEAGTEE